MMTAVPVMCTGVMACVLSSCQTTEPTVEPPPVVELRKSDGKDRAKTDLQKSMETNPGYIWPTQPSERAGDWNKGAPVSGVKNSPANEG